MNKGTHQFNEKAIQLKLNVQREEQCNVAIWNKAQFIVAEVQ